MMAEADDATQLAKMFAEMSRSLLGNPSMERTLQEVVELAARTVDGAACAGITVVRRDGTVESPAYTDDLAVRVDRAQAELGEGPCLEASYEHSVLRVDDMAVERRWPRFARRAERLGVRSMIACGLAAQRGERAALNLHAPRPGAFDSLAVEIASICAAHSSVALSQAALVASLNAAMQNRQLIGEATGILMERYRVNSRQAFDMLATSSQRLNVKLWIIAERVVFTGQDPPDIRPQDVSRPRG